jgi:hypothetical protein
MEERCPKYGAKMVRKGSYHHRLREEKKNNKYVHCSKKKNENNDQLVSDENGIKPVNLSYITSSSQIHNFTYLQSTYDLCIYIRMY